MSYNPIKIIDLFAGPGGLSEGFCSYTNEDGDPVFSIAMSIEKDKAAHSTLRMRAFARKIFSGEKYPKEYLKYLMVPSEQNRVKLIAAYPKEWEAASYEAVHETLKVNDKSLIIQAKERLQHHNGPLVLIGGPPCQAYSLVGRARRTHDSKLATDEKQTLYKCYLDFINNLSPDVFIMENVKGLLSAKLKNNKVFDLIRDDMLRAGYQILSLVVNNPQQSEDFIVRSEEYGIPQSRHRVILLGIRENSRIYSYNLILEKCTRAMTVRDAIDTLPNLRSAFSSRNKDFKNIEWADYIQSASLKLARIPEGHELKEILLNVAGDINLPIMTKDNAIHSKTGNKLVKNWYRKKLKNSYALANHETRTHLATDLDRYLFCAAYGQKYGTPAKLWHFPDYLLPNHKNALNAKKTKNKNAIKFADRFRVQLFDRPATTITSHISKDGHYYIHPDPRQCRTLTVREAARLQTFPDDYIFEGNRTEQYCQVGNAVPPLLARQIAEVVANYLTNKS